MVDIPVNKNSQGLTYELANYAKSVNGGKALKLNAKKWESVMKVVTDINNKRSADNAIFTGGTNLFGNTNENFVIANSTLHFSDDEIALILKEMGVEVPQQNKETEIDENFKIKGLSVEHQDSSLRTPLIKEPQIPQISNTAQENKFLMSKSYQLMSSSIKKDGEISVTSAKDSVNLAPPFEIKTPIPGPKGGGTKTISEAFHKRALEIADKIGCKYEDLITVMNFESGIDPSVGSKNPKRKPVGLIQFAGSAIRALNKTYGLELSKEKVIEMSELEQLDLVEKYFLMTKQGNSRLRNKKQLDAADLYSLTILPTRAGRDILCHKDEKNSKGELLSYYESNQGIDVGGDGVITREDILAKLNEFRINVKVV